MLNRSSCLNYLHRLGFVLKRPKKHFLKADDAKREAFLATYAVLLVEARQVGAKRPAIIRRCAWETGEVEVTELRGYSNAETSTAFLKQLRDKHAGPLNVIWDNAPVHHGDALRAYLTTPGLRLQSVSLPGYSPDFNAAEVIWDWAREEVTANLCLGTRAAVQEKFGHSSPSWPTAPRRSSNGAGPSCRLGQRSSSETLKPVFIPPSM